ncbi:MAG: PAS domain S-box protein [Rubrivivax sp.]|nr:PAS domain S-box protein [Rubrivivax sp.]
MKPLDLQLARRIVEDAPVLAVVLGVRGDVVYLNPFCQRLIGYELSELQSRDWFDILLVPAERAETRARFDRMIAGEPSVGAITSVAARRGGVRQIEWSSQRLVDADGRVTGLLAIGRDVTERGRAEEQLRDSEQRYRQLFEANPNPMWVYDLETLRFLTVNDAATAQYGYKREEFLALTLPDIRPADDHARLADSVSQVKPGFLAAGHWTHLRKDGTRLQVQISSHDIVYGGRAARMVLAHDVTAQLALERQLQLAHREAVAAHDRLRDVLERIDDGFVALGLDWRYTYVNQRAAVLLDRKVPADLLGRHIWQEYPDAEGQDFHLACEQALRSQQLVLLEQHFVPGDRWFENRIYPSPDGLSIYFTDITRRRLAQQALRQSEERFRHFFDAGLVGMAITLPNKRWEQFNARMCEMLGRSAAEMRRLTWAELTHPDDLAANEAALDEVLAGRRDGYSLDKRFVRGDGSILHAAISVRCERDAQGRAERFFAVVEDIGVRKQAEAALTRHRDDLERLVQARTKELVAARDEAQLASRAKGDFLSRTSHELRTPLNAILGFGQLLEGDPTLAAHHQAQLQEMMRAGHHLLTLINDVLDLARIESGALQLSLESLSLAELAADGVRMVASLAASRGVQVHLSTMGGLEVRADRRRLQQVLLNLLSNAIKYNRDGGHVDVSAERVAGGVRIAVADTGPGVPPERQAGLFQPFQRLGAEYGNVEGTGMGLAISQQLVELMDGRIGFAGVPEGGARFWVELPAASQATMAEAACADGSQPRARPATRGERRVLYIEDNAVNQLLVEQIASRHDSLRLLTAQTGQQGLALAAAEPPDLILLDIHLPDLDGYAVLERLRADPVTREVPVFALTADAMSGDAERARQKGFAGYLTKPLDVTQMDGIFNRLRTGHASRR